MPGVFLGGEGGGGGGGSSFFLGTTIGPISPCGPPASGGAVSDGFCCCPEFWSVCDCATAAASSKLNKRHRIAPRLTARMAILCPGEQDDGRFSMNPSGLDYLCASIDAP